MLSLVVQHSCWLFIVRVCHCPSSVSNVMWLSCYKWWCGPVLVGSHLTVVLEWCSVVMGQWQSFLVLWLSGVLSLGLAVSLVWAVVFVVEECYVQTQRWDCLHMMISPEYNNLSYAIPPDILGNASQNNKMKPKKVIGWQCDWRKMFLIFLFLCSTLLDIYFVWTVFWQLKKHQIFIFTMTS